MNESELYKIGVQALYTRVPGDLEEDEDPVPVSCISPLALFFVYASSIEEAREQGAETALRMHVHITGAMVSVDGEYQHLYTRGEDGMPCHERKRCDECRGLNEVGEEQ